MAGSITLKDWETSSAGATVSFPGWLAVISTTPASPVNVTVFPLIVAGPDATTNSTSRP